MLRVLLYVLLLAALFMGAVVYTGNAIGAWETKPLPEPGTAPVSTEREKAKKPAKDEKAQQARAIEEEPRRTQAQRRWIGQANTVCKRAQRATERVADGISGASESEAVAIFGELVRLNARYNDEFLALETPKGYERPLRRLREIFGREERVVGALYTALKRQDVEAYADAALRLGELSDEAANITAGLGALSCAPQILPVV